MSVLMKSRLGFCVLALLALCAVLVAFAWQEVDQILEAYRHRAAFAALGRSWGGEALKRLPAIATYVIFITTDVLVLIGLLRRRPWARWVMLGLTICCGWAAATSFGWDSFHYDSDWEMYWILVAGLALLALSGRQMRETYRPAWDDDGGASMELLAWGVALAISALPILLLELELSIRSRLDIWGVVRQVAAFALIVTGALQTYRGRRFGLWWLIAATPILVSMLWISRTGYYSYPLLPAAVAPVPILVSHLRR